MESADTGIRSGGVPRELRVLIVEDSPDFADVVVEVVQSLGHSALAVNTLREARDHLKAAPRGYDVLLSDLRCPDGSGLDLARQVAADKACGRSSIRLLVAISGLDGDQHRDDARAAGFHEFLLKPIKFEQLEHLLSAAAAREA